MDPNNMTPVELVIAVVEHKRFRELVRCDNNCWYATVANIIGWGKTRWEACTKVLQEIESRKHMNDENAPTPSPFAPAPGEKGTT